MLNNTFLGIGKNPDGPDLPLGFGLQLAQNAKAIEHYASLSNSEKEQVIGYIQASTSGDDAKSRIAHAVESLRDGKNDFFR